MSGTNRNCIYLPELTEYRKAQRTRRAEAFCEVETRVLGTRVLPLTPRTYSMLVAAGNRFACGGIASIEDVWRYVWYHSPLYAHTGQWFWRLRRWVALFRLRAAFNQPWKRFLGLKPSPHAQRAILLIATAEIRKIVDDAFAEAPPPSERPNKPIATTEAFFIHEFGKAYGWPPERTSNTPMARLLQLHRCVQASITGEDPADEGEDKIWAAHMDREQAKHEEALRAAAAKV